MKKKKSDTFDKILKMTPLKTRLKVLFSMEYLLLTIHPDRSATDEEMLKADEWGENMAVDVIREYKRWKKDRSPIDEKND